MMRKEEITKAGPLWYFVLFLTLILLFPPVFIVFQEISERWAWLLMFSLSMSFVLTPGAILLSRVLGVIDIPDDRKDHKAPTPSLGSLPVAISFFLALLINGILSPALLAVVLASFIILVVGILEEVAGVREWVRLIAQFTAFVVVASAGVLLELFPPTLWGNVFNIILSFLWIVGITNAMNFIDGLDGLCAGVASVIAFFLGIIAVQTHQPELGWMSVALMGACLGFIPYNFVPKGEARIFLGDAGSSFLGFILASLAILGEWSANNPIVSFSTPILIFGVLIYDMLYTNINRIVKKKVRSLSQLLSFVGLDHTHHRIAAIMGDKKLAVLFILMLNVILGLGTLALRDAATILALALIFQAILLFTLITILEVGSKKRGRRKGD